MNHSIKLNILVIKCKIKFHVLVRKQINQVVKKLSKLKLKVFVMRKFKIYDKI